MINALQLTYGDIVKYNDQYFMFLGIHRRYDSKTSELLETYAIYEGAYHIKALIEDSSISEVEITRALLEKIGFEFGTVAGNPDGIRASLGDYIHIYYIGKDEMDLEILTAETTVAVRNIQYLHELQECMRAAGLYKQAEMLGWI